MVKELSTLFGTVKLCSSNQADISEGFVTHIDIEKGNAVKLKNFITHFTIRGKHRIDRGEFVKFYYNPDTYIVQGYSVWKSKESFEKSIPIPLYSFGEV